MKLHRHWELFLHVSSSLILQVIYRALSPWHSVDPYGPDAQDQLMITNLRVRLLQHQPCPCQSKHSGVSDVPTDHYAIYDFIVKGSCLCNGHADHCVPAKGYNPSQQRTSNMVSILYFVVYRCTIHHHGKLLVKKCCVTPNLPMPSVCLQSFLVHVVRFGVEGLGLCSHHSLVTQLCAGMCY